MSENVIKVSELSRLSSPLNPVNLLLTSKKTGAEFDSYAVTAGDIQALIFKDNAFDTVQAGLNATQINEQFYVYTDASKNFVEAFTNVGTSSYLPVTLNGKTRRYPTAFFFENMSTVYGFDLITPVANFNMLRALPVTKEGQRVRLSGYNTGTAVGAGEFIGHYGVGTDDGGIIASGPGFYWQRVLPDGLVRASHFNLGSGVDETTKYKSFCAAPYDKVLDQNVIVSGLGILADNTSIAAINGSTITLSASISDPTGSNQGQCLKAGNYSKLSNLVINGGAFGGGILVTYTTGVTIDNCRVSYSNSIMIRCAYDKNTTITNSWLHHGKHGIQMWLSQGTKIDNCTVNNISGTGNNGGGIFTASARSVTVSNCTVFNCADVGIDFEGGRDCVSFGNELWSCAHGELTIFATGTQSELINSGFLMGNLVHRDNVVRRYSYYYDATDTLRNNDLTDVAALMVYGNLDTAHNGSIDFINNVVSVESASGNSTYCFRSRTSPVGGNAKIRFLNNIFSTVSGHAGTLLDRQDLVFEGNSIEFISGTLTVTEVRDHRSVIWKNNRVLVRNYDTYSATTAYPVATLIKYTDGLIYQANDAIPANTPWAVGTTGATWTLTSFLPVVTGNTAFMFNTASGSGTPPNGKVAIENNTFDGMDGIWINITQAYVTRLIDIAENRFNNGAGMTTFPILVSGGTIRYRKQEFNIALGNNVAIDFSAITAIFYARFSSVQNEFLVSTGGSAGPAYRFFLRNNNSGNASAMVLEAIDAGGAINTGISKSGTMFATFSGTTIVATSTNSTSNRAICRLRLDWFA